MPYSRKLLNLKKQKLTTKTDTKDLSNPKRRKQNGILNLRQQLNGTTQMSNEILCLKFKN